MKTEHSVRRAHSLRRRGMVLLAAMALNSVPWSALWAGGTTEHAHACDAAHHAPPADGAPHGASGEARHPHHPAPAHAAHPEPRPHPTPREGITAEKVITPERLLRNGYGQHEADVYALVAQIPQIIDGLYCYCHCTERSGHYSLLTCFENGHAANCITCLGTGELAAKLHEEGKSLDEIRAAVDAQFGGRANITH
jgi:hypothetical protein